MCFGYESLDSLGLFLCINMHFISDLLTSRERRVSRRGQRTAPVEGGARKGAGPRGRSASEMWNSPAGAVLRVSRGLPYEPR